MKKTPANRTVKKAVVRFAILEAAAMVLLAMIIAYLFVFDNGLTTEEAVFRLLVAITIFVIYVGFLFITVLMPVLGRGRDAH